MAASQPPGHKALGPNSSSLHTTYREDKPKSTSYVFSDLKVGCRANQSKPQPKIKQSDIPVKHDISHSHDITLGHSDTHITPVDSIHSSKPTVTATANVPIKDPMYSSLPFVGETHHEKPSHYSLKYLCDEVVHHVPPSNPYQV